MGDFANLIAPFFSTPQNYSQMRKKIAGFAVYEVYFITLFLRDIPQIGHLFRSIETYKSFGALLATFPNSGSLNLAGLIVAVLVAVLCHVAQLYNRISDLFGIRRRFDRDHILVPLATRAGVGRAQEKVESILKIRHSVMDDVFYRYASSTDVAPLAGRHNIEQALGAWSWFWAGVECFIFLILGALIACLFSATVLAWAFVILASIVFIGTTLQHSRLPKYARSQVDAIASDPAAIQAIKGRFDAL